MKKVFIFFASVALLSFASCTDDMQEFGAQQQELKQIVMTTQDFEPEAGSRTLYQITDGAVQCTWAANDTVGVFPDEGIQTAFPMASGAGTKNATFDGGGWALKDGSTYAAYYPNIGEYYLDKHAVPVDYTGQAQNGNASVSHLDAYDYMVAAPVAPEFGSAKFLFKHLGSLVGMKLIVPQPAVIHSVSLVADTDAFAVNGNVDIMTVTPSITPVTFAKEVKLDLQNVQTTEENQEITLYLMVPPADLMGKTLKAVVKTDEGVKEIALEGKNFQSGKAYGLSGSLEDQEIVGDGTYKDGVVSLAEAGTMRQLLGSDYLNITELKVVGPINSDDVYYLRKMLGASEFDEINKGKLISLDLSEATIKAGGEYYYADTNYKYYLKDDMMGDYMFSRTNIQHIKLPENIHGIGSSFQYCKSLKEVEIPGSVVSMTGSFAYCYNLSKVIFKGANLTTLGGATFKECDLRGGMSLPESVKAILYSVFENSKISEIVIPGNVSYVGYGSFKGCEDLKKIVLSEGVGTLENYAFQNCINLEKIEIPNSVTSIGSYAFDGCNGLSYATIGERVKTIGYAAFRNCETMTSVTMRGDSLTTIGDHAFYGCNALESVTMSKGTTSVGEEAFRYCEALSSVYITDLSAWCKVEFKDISSNPIENRAKLYLNGKELTELIIPEDVTVLKNSTFAGCQSLTKVTIGNQVTSIGEFTFTDCDALVSVTIGDGVTEMDYMAFDGCKVLDTMILGKGIKSLGSFSIYGCTALKKLYCYAATPPSLSTSTSFPSFSTYGEETILYVPLRCATVYKSSKWGKYFKTIAEMD